MDTINKTTRPVKQCRACGAHHKGPSVLCPTCFRWKEFYSAHSEAFQYLKGGKHDR